MEPEAKRLVMYGSPASVGDLDWGWVDEQLATAGAYWVVVEAEGQPHPRPVWGVWHRRHLHLSVGSPTLSAGMTVGRRVTAHLGSATDVVIVDGEVRGDSTEPDLLRLYNSKYDWDYTIDEYGPLTVVAPAKVMAWRSGGWAGRDGFRATGRWNLSPDRRSNRGETSARSSGQEPS